MDKDFDAVLKSARKLTPVPLAGATAYTEHAAAMTEQVNAALAGHPDISALTGGTPLQMMHENHRNHCAFMGTVFTLGSFDLLAAIVPWVYHAYASHGYSYDYFPAELNAWKKAVDELLPAGTAVEIKAVYDWMLKMHGTMIELAGNTGTDTPPVADEWLERKTGFMAALLDHDNEKCLEIARTAVKDAGGIEALYVQIIHPVMYEVGMLWERGDLSVAQEHLASASVGRIMARISVENTTAKQTGGKIIISSAPNEFHEIGAWMLSDILEHAGWDARTVGANTPADALISMLEEFRPDILALSVTMPFNIVRAGDIIKAIRENSALKGLKVMVGGRVFNEVPGLWQKTGADGFAPNAKEAKELAETWLAA